ncbi:Pre-mRNA-splicing factor cwf16 [Coemansia spiralis]|uniref:Splicing factor YJU2 n=2 Tax=Coemansia TaxID=4863 RepID=A0A9W8KYN3_9FUNG|nr:CWC16 protein [Coemansia spiralis]KAJ1994941.1 Pre-mRNA-splicing factor cwf16 [Coemansia umbellata]KAJ2624621.1 Pre-mRNA-splicing factor cwf16 [Coemansia sp. RSA 1358]KAJ2679792.1 Pre-mRNA-splicing factor cwf16 [Coemansia spiralis]
MAERKVLNKYIPPDFDPAKIPRLRLGKNRQIKVRLVAPFSMRCETCGQWIGKGTKFNARKESIEGEKFHSIQVFRFYIRCQRCAAEITYKTDPENLNYQVEKGAQRNFEPWREEKEINETIQREKEEEEENNPIKALENRTEASRREMEIMDELDEIRLQNAKSERVMADDVLETIAERKQAREEEIRSAEEREDEELVKQAFSMAGSKRVKRVQEEDAVEKEREIKKLAQIHNTSSFNAKKGKEVAGANALSRALQGIKTVKPKNDQKHLIKQGAQTDDVADTLPTLAGILGAYGSDDESLDESSS